jgi:glycosyltransferase involved in cell wall biosynthesis
MNENIKNCVLIIPVYNEEKSIGKVLQEIPREELIEIIVVNNNSTDNTVTVAKSHGAVVVNEMKMGYGQACLTGIEHALKLNPSVIAFIDGDYSDNPSELKSLLEKIREGHELVIGSRVLGKAEKGALLPQAIFGNWLATRLMTLVFSGFKFTDLGPFRAITTSALRKLAMSDTDFGWTVEMQSKALIYDLSCAEISVSYKKRIGVSKITGTVKGTILAGYKILSTIFYLYLKSLLLPKR